MKKSINTTYVIVGAVLVGVIAFYAGMKYQQSQRATLRGNFAAGQFGGRAGGGQGGNGFRPVLGQIASIDNGTMTVKMTDGSSKIVILPGSVTVSKTDTGALSDLKQGDTVGVFGTANSDGSVTAQNVQLNPMFRMRTSQNEMAK